MSYSLLKVRRKKDGKVLYDLITDSCDAHDLFDYDTKEHIFGGMEWDIGYYMSGFRPNSEYEKLEMDDMSTEEWRNLVNELCANR